MNKEDFGTINQPKRSEQMEHNEIQAELKAVVEALRAHAAQSTELAERISKLIQLPMQPSGLIEVMDSMSINELMGSAREAFPEFSSNAMTLLTNALHNDNIKTVGDLRGQMKTQGRVHKEWHKTAEHWKRQPNVGKKLIQMLGAIVERFGI